jgi:hypothetical protein
MANHEASSLEKSLENIENTRPDKNTKNWFPSGTYFLLVMLFLIFNPL